MTNMKEMEKAKWGEESLSYLDSKERELAQRKSIEKSINAKWKPEITIAEVETWNSFQ